MRILVAALLHFALTFGAGFVLGTIRIPWMVPHLGTRMAPFHGALDLPQYDAARHR
jgi:hypothetical protein